MPTVLLALQVVVRLFSKAMVPYMARADSTCSVPFDSRYFVFLCPDLVLLFTICFRGVFTDPTLGPVLYYHYIDTTVGYADDQTLFGWNVIDFSSGWPVV
jgi:hypothetical protein